MGVISLKDNLQEEPATKIAPLSPFKKYIWMIFLPPLAFVIISTWQLNELNKQIFQSKNTDFNIILKPILDKHSAKATDPSFDLELAQLLVLTQLESDALNRRYHQANASMMIVVWVKFLSFLTGIILTLVGAVFILGKINDLGTTLNYDAEKFGKIAFQSSSPGIVLAVIGMVLILASFQSKSKGEIVDSPIYIGRNSRFNNKPVNMPESGSLPFVSPNDTTPPVRPPIKSQN